MAATLNNFDKTYDVVVVGGGIGGLSCGAFLAKQGKKVKVIEQHFIPGGYCTGFKRKGFMFDAAVHFIIGECEEGGWVSNLLRDLGVEAEIEFLKIPSPQLRAVFDSGEVETIDVGIGKYVEKLSKRFPDEKDGIKRLFQAMQDLYRGLHKLPEVTPIVKKYMPSTYKDILDEFLQDEKLKAILTLPVPIFGLPYDKVGAIWIATFLLIMLEGGLRYPKGSSNSFAQVFARALENLGGELELKTLVTKIMVENGKAIGVETKDGRKIGANHVVSNASSLQTFTRLIDEKEFPADFISREKSKTLCSSGYIAYIGTDLDLAGLGITHTTMVSDKLDIGLSQRAYDEMSTGRLPAKGLLFSVPTLTDPSIAPEGNHCIVVFAYAPYHLEGKEWKEVKEKILDDTIKSLECVIPDLSNHIVVKDAATPLTLEKFTLNDQGTVVGWDYSPAMTFDRSPNVTPVENLYLAGHWTLPGGGVATVAQSGYLVAQMILAKG